VAEVVYTNTITHVKSSSAVRGVTWREARAENITRGRLSSQRGIRMSVRVEARAENITRGRLSVRVKVVHFSSISPNQKMPKMFSSNVHFRFLLTTHEMNALTSWILIPHS
jgi:hypothetical protein